MVESQPSKLLVAGSIPVSRSIRLNCVPPLAKRSFAHGGPGRSNALSERGLSEAKADVRRKAQADVAQLAEHVLGKDEVTGSIPVISSNLRSRSGEGCPPERRSRGGGHTARGAELRLVSPVVRPRWAARNGPGLWMASPQVEVNG